MANNPIRTKKIKKLKRIRKWKKRSIVILSVFVFLIAFICITIYTSLGVKLTTLALNKWLPELKIAQVDGTFHDLHIKGFSLELSGVNVQIDEASFSLSGLCLLKTTVCVEHFDADGVKVTVNTNQIGTSATTDDKPPSSHQRFVVSMPLPIKLEETHLTKVQVNVDDMQFGMTDFTGKADWVNEKLYVYPAVAIGLNAIFADPKPTQPVPENSDNNIPLNQKINQLFNQPLIDSLPQVSIPLDINVTSLTGDNWLLHIGGEDYHFNQVTIKTDMVDNHIVVKQVDTDAKTPYTEGHATVSGEITLGNNWPVFALVKVMTENNQLDGQFSGKLLGELYTNTKLTGLNNLQIDGHINFIEKYLPVMVNLNGKHLQWPIEGQAQYQLDNFNLNLDGSVQQYKLNSQGSFNGDNLPNIVFDVLGNGTNQGATFDHAKVQLPQGDINISGDVNWQTDLVWNTNIKLNNVDISQELPSYPIKLAGKLQTSGTVTDNNWQLNLAQVNLKGSIKKADFTANGDFSIDSNTNIDANNFSVNWGKNLIKLNGTTNKGNLDAKLNLASLSLLVDDMQGSINGNIKMTGAVNDPTIDTNIMVNNLSLPDMSVAKANLTSKIQYQKQVRGQLRLTGQNIELPSLSIKKSELQLSGNENQHTLTLNSDGVPASLTTTLTGHLDKERTKWTGNITRALVNFSDKNHWQLNKSVALTYDINQQIPTIAAHCWLNANSSICLDKQLSVTANSATSVTLKDIDLAKLPIPNDGETKLSGYINGKVNIQFNDSSNIPIIKANINSNKVYIQQMVTNQSLPIPFNLFNIEAEFNQQQAKLNWRFGLNELGKISGNLTIDDPMQQKKLSGQLVIDRLALAIINPLLDRNDYAKGAINGTIKFSGTLVDPYLTGGIDLRHSEIKTSQLPIDLKSAVIDINFNGKSSTLKGILTTQSGNININGHASWHTLDKWQASLTVNGAAMEVNVPPMVVMTVVPNITIKASQDELTLSGKVDIPKGQITVESLPPSSVDVSPDEVMLDKKSKANSAPKLGMKINSHLEINIGDHVKVDAFGLKASLTGHLIVLQDNKGLGVHGQILIPKGRFQAYGQDLIIRKGELEFAGPTDQVQLNIEAIRNPDSMDNSNITAGIRVTGTSDNPKVEIFSDPAMSQQEALSYLIRGQGLDSSEQSDNDMMTALLVGIGTAKTGKYIGDIGNIFGIKNLTLDTQGAGDSSKVVVSGYILPNLQLKYGVGIFDSLAVFTLRYRLMPSLFLEATSGLAQAVDLIYQFEFN
ncbi:autotransporter assembly complex protein TamB [Gilliamella sp. wkB112]|uniref:autotransporter assembly complex protein TamB n=1 Tax=Gilliamella sp. wkB112 TaxID=3120257 RepID=UPI00080E079F|nr:translocation/assembly module TamB domain-containing protein [Gilliamella apicola]OCG03037.1 hypothetical protein A9G12_08950 [Gilliamella apicola]